MSQTPPVPPVPPVSPVPPAPVAPVKVRFSVLARYGSMHQIGTFSTQIKNLAFGEKCILRSERGTEWAEVLSEIERSEGDPPIKFDGTILRRVTPKDYEHRQKIEEEQQPKEYTFGADKIAEHNLPMRLVSVEHIFGGEKIIFYFLAEGRVDFRGLVKDLATEYKTRIELRQIGVRDEARLLAEYEHCGRELCCRTFMKDLEPVTMRMAKLQKTTLDPTKISGRCGRLMCCLRYEDESYADLKSKLPKKGTRVRVNDGTGEVFSTEILAQKVTVELGDNRRVTVPLAEIRETLTSERPQHEEEAPEQPGERAEDGESRRRKGGKNRGRRDQDQGRDRADESRTSESRSGENRGGEPRRQQPRPPQGNDRPQPPRPRQQGGARPPDAARNDRSAQRPPNQARPQPPPAQGTPPAEPAPLPKQPAGELRQPQPAPAPRPCTVFPAQETVPKPPTPPAPQAPPAPARPPETQQPTERSPSSESRTDTAPASGPQADHPPDAWHAEEWWEGNEREE